MFLTERQRHIFSGVLAVSTYENHKYQTSGDARYFVYARKKKISKIGRIISTKKGICVLPIDLPAYKRQRVKQFRPLQFEQSSRDFLNHSTAHIMDKKSKSIIFGIRCYSRFFFSSTLAETEGGSDSVYVVEVHVEKPPTESKASKGSANESTAPNEERKRLEFFRADGGKIGGMTLIYRN